MADAWVLAYKSEQGASHREHRPANEFKLISASVGAALAIRATIVGASLKDFVAMLSVYISSTYKDLVDERAAVKQAIMALGHFPLGMEEYGAAEERPLDKCLRDVRKCKAYVGIIAWRYGFCPPGSEKSITQLEYEAAEAAKVPRYVFILKEEAPWPRNFVPDEDQPRVRSFRQLVEMNLLAGHFGDKEELARLVIQSLVSGGLRGENEIAIPPLLPYLCDRSEQESALADLVVRLHEKPQRPVVCVVHGDEGEAHDKFLERLQKVTLPRLLPRETERAAIQEYLLHWPESERQERGLHGRLLRSLSDAVLDTPLGTMDSVSGRLSQALGPLAIHTHTITENWEQQSVEVLPMFLRFWEGWPDLAVGQMLFIFMFIKYQLNRNFGFFKRRQYARINDTLREAMQSYAPTVYPQVTLAVLPELQGPTQGDAETWARRNETRRFFDSESLLAAISEYYAEWEEREKPRTRPVRIPTDQLVTKLREIMSHTQIAEERTV